MFSAAVALAPEALIQACQTPKRQARKTNGHIEADTPQAIYNARLWLQNSAPEAIEGSGGDHTTFAVACGVRDYGVSEAACFELMAHWNEQKAFPMWSDADLRDKIANAYAYPQNDFGCKSAQAQFSVVAEEPQVEPASLILTGSEFTQGFVPPDYLVEGILQRRFFYWMTARTGHAKTTICLLLAALVATGRDLGGRQVQRGDVLYFAGENPDDIRMRVIALVQEFGLSEAELNRIHFMPGVRKLSQIGPRIRAEVERKKLSLGLVIVDTSQAFYEGDDDNSNVEMLNHARRMRALVDLPGGPTVLVAAHPIKNADETQLIPRGGSAALNEADGNLTAYMATPGIAQVHWCGKFRGADFAPLMFEIKTVTCPTLKTSAGKEIPTVVAKLMDAKEEEAAEHKQTEDENAVLMELGQQQLSSVELAKRLKWFMGDGRPYRVRVHRALKGLQEDGLVRIHRKLWVTTKSGQKELVTTKGQPFDPSSESPFRG